MVARTELDGGKALLLHRQSAAVVDKHQLYCDPGHNAIIEIRRANQLLAAGVGAGYQLNVDTRLVKPVRNTITKYPCV